MLTRREVRWLLLLLLTLAALTAGALFGWQLREEYEAMCIKDKVMDIDCRNAPWYKEMVRTCGWSEASLSDRRLGKRYWEEEVLGRKCPGLHETPDGKSELLNQK